MVGVLKAVASEELIDGHVLNSPKPIISAEKCVCDDADLTGGTQPQRAQTCNMSVHMAVGQVGGNLSSIVLVPVRTDKVLCL